MKVKDAFPGKGEIPLKELVYPARQFAEYHDDDKPHKCIAEGCRKRAAFFRLAVVGVILDEKNNPLETREERIPFCSEKCARAWRDKHEEVCGVCEKAKPRHGFTPGDNRMCGDCCDEMVL